MSSRRWTRGRRPIRAAALPCGLVLAAGMALVPAPTGGQSVSGPPTLTPQYGLFIRVGLEPQLAMSLGYIRRVGPKDPDAGFGVGAGVKIPPYRLSHGSGRLNLIAAGHWMPDRHWGGAATSEIYVVRGKNRAGTVHGLGLEMRATPGYFGPSWSATADLGWQGTFLAHFRHSPDTRETFEDRYAGQEQHPVGDGERTGPVDGWYGTTAHRFRIGLKAGRTVSEGAVLQVAIGSLVSVQSQGILLGFAHGQVPAYLETSLHFRRSLRPP